MNLLNQLIQINPLIKQINLQEIRHNDEQQILGWEATIETLNNKAFSGGTNENKNTALRIAISEGFERSLFLKLFNQEGTEFKDLLLDIHPSTSGFACGFNKESTKFRSICEGLERWAWSQWIDYGFKINPLPQLNNTSALGHHFISKFDHYSLFRKDFYFDNSQFYFVVFLGEKENGIFAGSRVSTINDPNIWEHAVIEAYRNLKNFNLSKSHNPTTVIEHDIIGQRARFFGENSKVAWNQINLAQIANWKTPIVAVSKFVETGINDVYLHRCLMQDYIGWHLGDKKRFVY